MHLDDEGNRARDEILLQGLTFWGKKGKADGSLVFPGWEKS